MKSSRHNTRIRVTLRKSFHGRRKNHRLCIKGLGLRRIGHTVELENTPCVWGMINKVNYLVRTEEVEE